MDYAKALLTLFSGVALAVFGFLWSMHGDLNMVMANQVSQNSVMGQLRDDVIIQMQLRSDLISQISRNVETNNTFIRANAAAIVQSQLFQAKWEMKWPVLAAELRAMGPAPRLSDAGNAGGASDVP